jgi:hypothetical protein
MLEVCGFTYDPTLDAYTNDLGDRVIRVDTIQAHTELWVAQWITETLPALEAEESIGPQQRRQQQRASLPTSGPAPTAHSAQTRPRTIMRTLSRIRPQST